jgi:hypothetical protein
MRSEEERGGVGGAHPEKHGLNRMPEREKRRESPHVAFSRDDTVRSSGFGFVAPRDSKETAESGSGSGSSPNGSADREAGKNKTLKGRAKPLLDRFLQARRVAWIKPKLTWPDMKVVIRIAISVSRMVSANRETQA